MGTSRPYINALKICFVGTKKRFLKEGIMASNTDTLPRTQTNWLQIAVFVLVGIAIGFVLAVALVATETWDFPSASAATVNQAVVTEQPTIAPPSNATQQSSIEPVRTKGSGVVPTFSGTIAGTEDEIILTDECAFGPNGVEWCKNQFGKWSRKK
jgi:hypothetical protein